MASSSPSHGPKTVEQPLLTADQAYAVLADKLSSRYSTVRKCFLLNKGNSKAGSDVGGNSIDRKQFRESVDRMGMHMTGEEFRKLWRRFDASGDGSISYAEFNNQIGPMVSPPCIGLQMNRPETPKMKDWQRKNFARAVKKKVTDIEACFKTFDMDGSGKISHAEFIQAMRRMGIRGVGDQESWQLMQKHRRPGNDTGEMLFEEFRDTMLEFLKVPTAGVEDEKPSELLSSAMEALERATGGNGDVLMKALKAADPAGRFEVDYDQFRAGLEKVGAKLSKEQVTALAKHYDPVDDGSVYYRELSLALSGGESAFKVAPVECFPNLAEFDIVTIESPVTGKPYEQGELAKRVAPRIGLSEAECTVVYGLIGLKLVAKDVMTKLDANKDGCLTARELAKALQQLGIDPTDDITSMLLAKFDTNKNGTLDVHEFVLKLGPFMQLSDANFSRLMLCRKNPLAPVPKERAVSSAAPATASTAPTAPAPAPSSSSASSSSSSSSAAAAALTSPREAAAASAAIADDETVNTANLDLNLTHAKMRKVLGRNWTAVLAEVKRKSGGPPTADNVASETFRDVLAKAGVPLTSKEVRALHLKYGSSGGGLAVSRLLADTFASPQSSAAAKKTARA